MQSLDKLHYNFFFDEITFNTGMLHCKWLGGGGGGGGYKGCAVPHPNPPYPAYVLNH